MSNSLLIGLFMLQVVNFAQAFDPGFLDVEYVAPHKIRARIEKLHASINETERLKEMAKNELDRHFTQLCSPLAEEKMAEIKDKSLVEYRDYISSARVRISDSYKQLRLQELGMPAVIACGEKREKCYLENKLFYGIK